MINLKFYRTSAGKSTFRTRNDTNKANFRCTADKKDVLKLSKNLQLLKARPKMLNCLWIFFFIDDYYYRIRFCCTAMAFDPICRNRSSEIPSLIFPKLPYFLIAILLLFRIKSTWISTFCQLFQAFLRL